MKFIKEQCKVLPLGRNSPISQYSTRTYWASSSLAEKDLGMTYHN